MCSHTEQALIVVELKKDVNAPESSKPIDSATQVVSFSKHYSVAIFQPESSHVTFFAVLMSRLLDFPDMMDNWQSGTH